MMITYLLQVSFCWIFFYLIYHTFLRKETFFGVNRIYLMSSLLLSLFIPQIGYLVQEWFSTSPAELGQVIYYVAETPQMISEIIVSSDQEMNKWELILYAVYGIGVLVALIRFGYGLFRIYQLYSGGQKIDKQYYILIETERPHLPFSFFHYVFVSKKIPLKEEVREIITHELCHVRNLHSLDIIALELIHILFWFNPILFLYKKALRQAHEYTADATVLEHSDTKNYGQILLGQTSSGIEVALANHFFNSQLKNRITMMYQKKSGKKALFKYLAAIPILVLTAFLFSNSVIKENPTNHDFKNEILAVVDGENMLSGPITIEVNSVINRYLVNKKSSPTELNNALVELAPVIGYLVSFEGEKIVESICVNEYDLVADTIPKPLSNNEVFTTVEQMPRFPGCEEMVGSNSEKETCSKNNMLQYIYNNLTYPKAARDNGIQGMSVIQFIVSKEGIIKDAKVIREIGGGCGEAALQVVNSMNNMPEKWIPGMQRGKAVDVMYTLPIRFKLDSDVKTIKKEQNQQLKTREKTEAFTEVEQMPRFPGCEDLDGSDSEKEECAKKNMLQYLYKNLTYPKAARDKGIQGMTVIQFVVSKEGFIKDAKVVKEIGGGCGEAALNIVNSMNAMEEKWTPGIQDGNAVDVIYTLPVRFKLASEPKTTNKVEEQKQTSDIKINADKIQVSQDKIEMQGNVRIDASTDEQPPLVVINGDVMNVPLDKVKIDPEEIKSINVLKNESALSKYGEKGKNGVIEILTKGEWKIPTKYIEMDIPHSDDLINTKNHKLTDSNVKPLYIIDGQVIHDEDAPLSEINPDNIQSVNVLKGKVAIQKYGEEATEGAIEITTNKNNSNNQIFIPAEINNLKFDAFLDEFKTFPVPTKGSINLEVKGSKGPLKVMVFSLDGKLIHTQEFKSFGGHLSTRLENADFTRTTAIIAVIQNDKVQTRKVIFE